MNPNPIPAPGVVLNAIPTPVSQRRFPAVAFEQTNVPENFDDWHWWIDDQLNRIAISLRQLTRDRSGYLLYGAADALVPLNTTSKKIQNYELSGVWDQAQFVDLDPVNGEIRLPTNGLYTISGYVLGNQGNSAKEEAIYLQLDVDGNSSVVDIFDVATDKTAGRSLQFRLTRAVVAAPSVFSLWMEASANMGNFTFVETSFEIVKITGLVEVP